MGPAWRTVGHGIVASVAVVASAGAPDAAEWRFTPSASLEQAYSDNVDLDREGLEESDLSTSVTASISGSGAGRHLDLNLSYSISRVTFWKDSDRDSFRHNLNSSANAELIDDILFFDTQATAREQFIDNTGAISGSPFNATNNRTTVVNFSAGPAARHRLGDFASAELRYRYNTVLVSQSGDESDIHTGSFQLSDGVIVPRLGWGFSAVQTRRITKGDDPSDERTTVNFDLSYAVDTRLSVNASAGYEVIKDDSLFDAPKGVIWSVGGSYRPSPKTDVSLSYGQRFEQSNVAMSARYSPTGRTSFVSTFSQTLNNSERRLADSLDFIFVDENGDFLDDRTGLPFDPTEPGLSFDSGTVRQDSFRLTMSGSRGRNSYSLSGFFNKRSSDRLGTDEFVLGGAATFGRSLSRAMSANVNLSYRNTDFGTADGRVDDFYTAGLNLSYRLASDISTGLTYNFTLRDASNSTGDLHENAVSVRLSKSF